MLYTFAAEATTTENSVNEITASITIRKESTSVIAKLTSSSPVKGMDTSTNGKIQKLVTVKV